MPALLPSRVKILLPLVVLVLAALLAWLFLRPQTASNALTLYGNVDIRQVDLGFRVAGRIRDVKVEEGARVRQGHVLALLDDDMLTQSRDQAHAVLAGEEAKLLRLNRGYRTEEVAQARASVAAAEAAADNARINLHRVEAMRRTNAISPKDLDNAKARHLEAAAQWRSASDNLRMLTSGYRPEDIAAQEASVQGAKAQLAHAQTMLDDSVLYAPQEGIVLTRAREAGAIVQTGQTVYTVSLTNPVWLRVYVNETHLGRITPGMPVHVAVDSAPGKSFAGEVGFISPTAEFTPKSVETMDVRTALVYRLRVRVEDPDNVMRQGMPVTVTVPLSPTP